MTSDDPNKANRFMTTRWTVVAEAGHASSPDAGVALQELCEAYWFPLYAFAKRTSRSREEAQDLTQAFFLELLSKNVVGQADRGRGKFRSFLLTSFKNFMSKEREKGRAQKRGGGTLPISLDFQRADSDHRFEPASGLTAEQIFDQQWALTLLERTFSQLEREQTEAGYQDRFVRLKGYLVGDHSGAKYEEVARELQISEAAAKKAASRMRARFRELLREEISQTVVEPGEIDAEIRSLFNVFQRK